MGTKRYQMESQRLQHSCTAPATIISHTYDQAISKQVLLKRIWNDYPTAKWLPNGYRMLPNGIEKTSAFLFCARDGYPQSWPGYQPFWKAFGTAIRLPNGYRMGTKWSSFRLKQNLMWKRWLQDALVKYNRFPLHHIPVIPTLTRFLRWFAPECSSLTVLDTTEWVPNNCQMGSKWLPNGFQMTLQTQFEEL